MEEEKKKETREKNCKESHIYRLTVVIIQSAVQATAFVACRVVNKKIAHFYFGKERTRQNYTIYSYGLKGCPLFLR